MIEPVAGDTEIETSGEAETAKVAVACKLPDCAVIVALPELTPLAKPPEPIVATFVFDELHCTELVTSFVLPSERWAVAENC